MQNIGFSFSQGLHPHTRLGHIEALEGAILLERRQQVISNNLANTNTAGFKKQGLTFEEYLLPQIDDTRRTAKGEIEKTLFTQGPTHETGNPLDFAIEGEGFFVVQTPAGNRYTRAGNFTLDAQNQLVTQEGYPVLGDGAPIILQDTTGKGIWLSEDGRFFVDETEMGRIDVVNFTNPDGLDRMGQNLYAETQASGQPAPLETVHVRQGFIEDSNINPVEEMVNMIDMFRAYEVQQKTLQSVDHLDDKAINEVGRPA